MDHFYPRPPRGGRRISGGVVDGVLQFLSTPSARRATRQETPFSRSRWISIHALREEGDVFFHRFSSNILHFYPRPPRGGRLGFPMGFRGFFRISIHALREEGDRHHFDQLFGWAISIHALREEGDRSILTTPLFPIHFYPRPPRGGRLDLPLLLSPVRIFLSTPSAGRATHPPTGRSSSSCISIHALREEGDDLLVLLYHQSCKFLSTPSARRATGR